MNDVQVALYARVSSEQQSEAKTVESQVSDLRAKIAARGETLAAEQEFVDDGYSGATLIRPALERLRDVIAAGGIDRLYVHCPDRLARNYAHQVLLLDEFTRAGVEVVFLNREVGQTPEDQLLLQVQGMIAEYERAKILERSRRGKRHGAQVGSVSVLSCAPYGYRYVNKQDSGGEARFDIILEEARVVRQIFAWVGRDRCTIGEVQRRLNQAKEPTRTGKTVWDRATIWGILKNPAYKGEAAFGKTHLEPLRPRLRARAQVAVCNPNVRTPPRMFLASNGSVFLFPLWLMPPCLRPWLSNYRKINNERECNSGEHAIYSRACLCVPVAGMLIMANPSVPVLAKAMSVPMRIIAVLDRMPIALVGCDCAGTSNC
jgi:DNA invertase Pin-like site-specific DNA recombinase